MATLYTVLKGIFSMSAEEIATQIVDGDLNLPHIIELLESLDPKFYEDFDCEPEHEECKYLGRGFHFGECLLPEGEQCPYSVDRRQASINGILRELTDDRIGYVLDLDEEDNYEYRTYASRDQ